MERRLAAILVADVVGYSRLMGDDEAGTLKRLKSLREELVQPKITERGGRKVVFVVKGQKVERRDVVLGLGDDEIIEVREGVTPGERVVVRGLETLTDNQRVLVSGS